VVIEDLGAGAAGTGGAHHPEIVVGRDADDLVVRQARDLLPDLGGLVIGVVDRDQKLRLVDAEILGQQLPREGDRVGFEVIPEGEISQHLEERVMARGVAHVVQIVVLAARAHAFLRRGRAHVVAMLDAGEQVLELDHARVREHQRRIVARHKRRAVDDFVPVAAEIVEEGRADIVQAGHGSGASFSSNTGLAKRCIPAQGWCP
jgi:hypothetical protein